MPRLHMWYVLLFLMWLPVGTVTAQEADFYVSPDGDDSWSGTLEHPESDRTDGPFATIVRAQAAVRALQAAEPDRSRPIVVMIREGTYYLTKPLVFAPQDSGTLDAPVVYRAYPGEEPVLSGGRPLEDWTVDNDYHWHANLEDVRIGTWKFSQLFVDDQRRFRPRVPRNGYFLVEESVPRTSEKDSISGDDRFRYAPESIRTTWDRREALEVVALHAWSASRLPVQSIDEARRTITFSGSTWTDEPYGRLRKGRRYFVENVREALDEPGEWYLDDETGRLTYIPKGGETPEETEVIAPRLEELVRIEGDVQREEWVKHIHFQGLTFAHTNWNLSPEGQSYPQAEIGLQSAINIVGGRNLVVDSCVVRNTGGYGIAFGRGSRHNQVENSELVDLGGGGIKIGHAGRGTWEQVKRQSRNEAAAISHNIIRKNTIAHGGRLHPASVGIWIGHSAYNRVEYNEIFDLYYTGISVGWTWGYDRNPAHHNKILYNHIHTIGQNVLSDMGGIYTLGVSPGTQIHHNHIHDVVSYDYGGWGLYTDEGSSFITMTNNLVRHTTTGGFHQHYGEDNRVSNNIFAFSNTHQIQRTRAEDHRSFSFTQNIVYYEQGQLLGGNWEGDQFEMDHNIYWRSDGTPVRFPGDRSLEEWQSERGLDEHSLTVDPQFTDPKNGNYRLEADSPADEIGFKPFDYREAGRPEAKILTKDLPEVPAGFK